MGTRRLNACVSTGRFHSLRPVRFIARPSALLGLGTRFGRRPSLTVPGRSTAATTPTPPTPSMGLGRRVRRS